MTIRRGVTWALLLAAVLRLYHVTAPLLGTNSWRQCDTAAMARNYYEHGSAFGWPEVDWGGAGPGWVQSEFPLYPFLVSQLYRVTGLWEPAGRLLSLLGSLFGLWAMAMLVRRIAGYQAAAWTAVLGAILPLNVYYGRAFMGEPMMLAALAGGVLVFDVWLERGGVRWFLASAAGVALAVLLKPVCLYIGLPLLILARHRYSATWWRRPSLWLYAALVIVPGALWYRHSGTVLAASGLTLMGDWRYGSDKWGTWSLLATAGWWNRILFQRLAEKHLTWPGFVLLLAGLAARPATRREAVFEWWLAAVLVYCAIASRGAYEHEHYELPFVLPATALMGRALARWLRLPASGGKARTAFACAVLVAATAGFSLWRLRGLAALEDPARSPAWRLGALVWARTEPGALVVFVNDNDPTGQYYAHRRGWPLHVNTIVERPDGAEDLLREDAGRGARYLAGTEELFRTPAERAALARLLARHPLVARDRDAFLLRLAAGRS